MKKLYIFFLCLFLITTGYSQLSIDLGPDSLHACANEPLQLQVQVQGGIQPLTVMWSDGSQGSTLSLLPTVGGVWISATVTDATNSTAIDSVWVHGHDACVWPGDANGDAMANNMDILPLGQSIGLSGPARPDAHFNWVGQPADSWNHLTSAGTDAVHADTDGNGIVDTADVQGIAANYVSPQTNPGLSLSSGGSGVPLLVNFPSGNVNPGELIIAEIMLGSAQFPADSVYGLAFSITYDAALFVPGSLQVQYDPSWLGTPGQDLITVDKDFPAASQVDIGLSRTNQQMRAGFGRIATIIVTVDDIAGKNNGIEMVNFAISHVSMTTKKGDPLEVSPETTQVGISLSSDREQSLLSKSWKVYPSPAQHVLMVEPGSSKPLRGEAVLLDLRGVEVLRQTISQSGSIQMDVRELPRGMYLFTVQTDHSIPTFQRIILE